MSETKCGHHPEHPAIAMCTACQKYICSVCHRTALNGFAICSTCGQESEQFAHEQIAAAENAAGFVSIILEVLKAPGRFIAGTPANTNWKRPFLMGLACLAIGTTITFIWQLAFSDQLNPALEQVAERAGTTTETARIALFLSIPFAVPFRLALHTLVFHLLLRVTNLGDDWRVSARLMGFAGIGFFWLVIPPLGTFQIGQLVAIFVVFRIKFFALRFWYQAGLGKALLVTIIPFVLTMGFTP